MTHRHFVRTLPYDRLVAGLEQAVAGNMVTRRYGPGGLILYKYTNSCVYDRGWDDFSLVARGLILDAGAERVIATPFPKFFNLGEMDETMPDEPFEVYEKLDGSLIILFYHGDRWNAVTRGSFESAQGRWAQDIVDGTDLSALVPGTTYLAEAVYPENRIVVKYDESALVFLAAYDAEASSCPTPTSSRSRRASAGGLRGGFGSAARRPWSRMPMRCPRTTKAMSCSSQADCGSRSRVPNIGGSMR